MIEMPEAVTLARQLGDRVRCRSIASAEAGHSPHKFAWYTGDPKGYGALLGGRTIREARSAGGIVELGLSGDVTLFFNDGANLRWHKPGGKLPDKHQLLLMLDDGSALTASVQMYGGMQCIPDAAVENPYLTGGRLKPSPLGPDFTLEYFHGLVSGAKARTLSAKAFLATEQRIPGLGNGVLQDILFNAGIHPKRKLETLSEAEFEALWRAVTGTLGEMTEKGGRDTESDLYGLPGGYPSILSRNTVGTACPRCGGTITKEPYLGGAIYYCAGCQKK